jgi:hypothetical protein
MRLGPAGLCGAFALAVVGCSTTDPGLGFIAEMDGAPAAELPPDWGRTKSLMHRPAPSVGEPAPDFALPTPDGAEVIGRSAHQAGRPLVLVFGSFT